jgi:hypothetical protein
LPAGQVVADVVVRSGRARADDGLEAASATVELVDDDPAATFHFAIADPVEIKANGGSRFNGRVAEMTLDSAQSPAHMTVVAIGNIAYLDRVSIPLPIPAETADLRAGRVLAAAGLAYTLAGGASYRLAAYGADGDSPAGADEVLGQVMTDTGAVVQDLGTGGVLVQFPDGRTGSERWTPDPAKTHVALQWEQTDDLVNDITVTFPGGSSSASSSASIDKYGRHATVLQTQLADSAVAYRRASSIASRLGYPAWALGSAETWDDTFFAHGVGAIVTLGPLPESSPVAGPSWDGVLEGWTETYAPGVDDPTVIVGTYDLAIGDLRHSTQTVVWLAVQPTTLQWHAVDPATSWFEAVTNDDLNP